MRFIESFRVQRPADAVLEYAADFRNLPDWDPSITAVEKKDGGGVDTRSKFRVHLKFLGFDSAMDYIVEAYEPGKYARLRGTTPLVTAIDTVTVVPHGKATDVTWDAEIRFAFPLSLLDFAFTAAFRPSVQEAVEGLKRALRRLPKPQ